MTITRETTALEDEAIALEVAHLASIGNVTTAEELCLSVLNNQIGSWVRTLQAQQRAQYGAEAILAYERASADGVRILDAFRAAAKGTATAEQLTLLQAVLQVAAATP